MRLRKADGGGTGPHDRANWQGVGAHCGLTLEVGMLNLPPQRSEHLQLPSPHHSATNILCVLLLPVSGAHNLGPRRTVQEKTGGPERRSGVG